MVSHPPPPPPPLYSQILNSVQVKMSYKTDKTPTKKRICGGNIKHELGVASYEFNSTSYKFQSTSY